MSRPTVLLFDIDGTLLTTGGSGRRAIERAFTQAFGRSDACSGFGFGGMTDRAIARGGLTALGIEPTPKAIDALLEVYLRELALEVAQVDAATYRALEGTREAVALGHANRCAVGLGTGNLKEGARLKLERVDFYAAFDFGGFGCDAEDRPELIRVGAQRGAQRLGVPLEDCRVVVIGDTPKDVLAAQAMGAECLAVATGGFTLAQLEATGPTHAVARLTDASVSGFLVQGR